MSNPLDTLCNEHTWRSELSTTHIHRDFLFPSRIKTFLQMQYPKNLQLLCGKLFFYQKSFLRKLWNIYHLINLWHVSSDAKQTNNYSQFWSWMHLDALMRCSKIPVKLATRIFYLDFQSGMESNELSAVFSWLHVIYQF